MPRQPVRHLIGLYSGQAADGIDAALVRAEGKGERIRCQALHHVHMPLPEPLAGRVRQAAGGGRLTPAELSGLDRLLGEAFAEAGGVLLDRAAEGDGVDVAAVGVSGQVVHAGSAAEGHGELLLLGRPALLAARLNRPVAGEFATAARSAGARGGRVAGWADWVLLHDRRLSRVTVHLGAIATCTFLPAGCPAADALAFDAGPGTWVLDALCRRHFGCDHDDGGGRAAHGQVHRPLLNELLARPFFHQPLPRHTTASEWGAVYLQRLEATAERHRCPTGDLLSTATELSARAIAQAVAALTERPHQVVLSGGGARNIHLAGRVRALLSPSSTVTSEKFGLGLSAKAAVCQALLAAATVDKLNAWVRHSRDPASTAAGVLALPPARPIDER